MDLANMRAQVPVPAFGPRMVCARRGIIGAFARPNWQERGAQENLTRKQWQ
jgi:hypothetical protein